MFLTAFFSFRQWPTWCTNF